MRYVNPLAVLFMSLLIAADPEIGVVPVLAFLAGLMAAFLPPTLGEPIVLPAGLGVFYLLPLLLPPLLPYLAPAVFWHAQRRQPPMLLLLALPALLAGLLAAPAVSLQAAALSLLAYLLGRLSDALEATESSVLGDMDRERAERLRAEAEKDAKAKAAEQEVRLATLAERNRIARELHDTIGHVIASALLQTTAALAIPDGEAKDAGIRDVQTTLRAGMDQARQSVHSLYEQSLSFERELKEMTDRFTHCRLTSRVRFDREPPHEYRQAMLKAVGEALTNVVRHSNASEVSITADEHPGFYRLKIKDNGTRIETEPREGVHLGLDTMQQRVMRLGGSLRIERQGGFGLILALPKEKGTAGPAPVDEAIDE